MDLAPRLGKQSADLAAQFSRVCDLLESGSVQGFDVAGVLAQIQQRWRDLLRNLDTFDEVYARYTQIVLPLDSHTMNPERVSEPFQTLPNTGARVRLAVDVLRLGVWLLLVARRHLWTSWSRPQWECSLGVGLAHCQLFVLRCM